MRILLILSSFLVSFVSCKSQQYTLDELPETQLIFGSGGGVTGEVSTYTILENGQVFYTNSFTKEKKEMKSIRKKEVTACYEKMQALQLSNMDFDHPGNRYYFLEEVNGDERHRVTWGSADYEFSEACKELYEELRTTIK